MNNQEKLIKWIDDYINKSWKIYGTDKHGIDPDDLKEFIKTLYD